MSDPIKEREKASSSYRQLGLAMSIPFMLASGPIIGWFIGRWLDARFGTSWLTLTMLALGFVAGVRSVIRTLREDLNTPPIPADIAKAISANAPGDDLTLHRARFKHDGASIGSGYAKVDAVEVDRVVIGTISYSRRNRSGDRSFSVESGEPAIIGGSDEFTNKHDDFVNTSMSEPEAAKKHHNLLSLPNIVATGMWITALVAGSVAILINTEKALGLLAGGLWNLVNFTVVWLTFKTAFSKHPMRVFFTLPLICIKIPLLYTLVVALYVLKLFDPLGLTLGLLVLPAVILFLAIIQNRN